ncbi:hypothetical protein ALP8811_03114 [Aliiroseovarius pelagivivens]|uniref:Histidine kinase/HSP90-like ATPase domain-containing protein n=1 Tax=Aliiroseovarius pelagivivens TaxID=1639690 RepID=A0A2R8ASY3_9RHOB|nr:hypothetical protein [Aliiroseovarius pelagivivens]SPF79176.1 hypothetical protein ALP8811_03114 [Aliiroseovarius pelagivivens]
MEFRKDKFMKKLKFSQKERLERLRKKRRRSDLRRRNYLYSGERYLISMPEAFNLSSECADTLACIQEIKKIGNNPEGRQSVIQIDFSKTKWASAAAMLVLNAEIDRIMSRHPTKVRLIASRLGDWAAHVVMRLEQLGFFDLIGIELGVRWPDEWRHEEVTVLPMIACNKLDPARVQRIRTRLEQVANVLEQGPELYEAMIEATGNAVDHAYPEDEGYNFSPLDGKPWWATGVFSASRAEVSVVVFDQGVGIPATLNRWHLAERVRSILGVSSIMSSLVKDHARMIAAALEVSRTSKGSAMGRGQGLTDVISPVEGYGKGRVRILSGAGGIIYTPNQEVELFSLPRHIGGTLIEWSLPVEIQAERQAS